MFDSEFSVPNAEGRFQILRSLIWKIYIYIHTYCVYIYIYIYIYIYFTERRVWVCVIWVFYCIPPLGNKYISCKLLEDVLFEFSEPSEDPRETIFFNCRICLDG